MATIDVPDLVRDGSLACIVSMSGGKDSTATALALREAGVEASRVFADTGWEAPETYAHLDHLREKLGPIDVVGASLRLEGVAPPVGDAALRSPGMAAKIMARAGFPSRMQRWCTRELKLRQLRAYHDLVEASGAEACSVVGVRGGESASRAKMLPWEDDETWGGWVWRPILAWTVDDVLAIHHRHGVDVNPLYKRGHSRVGCYPCIYAGKEEIRLVAEHAPERIDEIRALEEAVTAERVVRNAVTPGRYAHPTGTYFQSRVGDGVPMPIDRVVEWSRTTHGGRQLSLLQPPPAGGCFRWGMCEPPTREGED